MPPKSYAYWEWKVNPKTDTYKPFDKEESIQLEKTYRAFKSAPRGDGTSTVPTTVQFVISGKSYTFDICGLTQTNDVTGTVREIRRVKPGSSGSVSKTVGEAAGPVPVANAPISVSVASGSGAENADSSGALLSPPSSGGPAPLEGKHYVWQWQSHDKYVDYDPLISTKIETAYQKDALVVDIGSIPVSAHDTADVKIHFGYMHQINKDTDVTRKIRRVERDGPAPALFSKPPITKPYNEDYSDGESTDSTVAEDADESNKDATKEGSRGGPPKAGVKRPRS